MTLPPLTDQMTHLATDMAAIVASGWARSSDDEDQRRLGACLDCVPTAEEITANNPSHPVGSPGLIGQERCFACGCFVEYRTIWAALHCPIGRW